MRNRFTNERGFGFIEMMIVVMILAIIAAIAVPSLLSNDDETAPLEQAITEVPAIDAALVSSAAELYAMNEMTTDAAFTVGDLIDFGYLNAEVSDADRNRLIRKNEAGGFILTDDVE